LVVLALAHDPDCGNKSDTTTHLSGPDHTKRARCVPVFGNKGKDFKDVPISAPSELQATLRIRLSQREATGRSACYSATALLEAHRRRESALYRYLLWHIAQVDGTSAPSHSFDLGLLRVRSTKNFAIFPAVLSSPTNLLNEPGRASVRGVERGKSVTIRKAHLPS
jgi:hypothetical protein